VAQFAGLWSGSYKLTSCSGERHCVLFVGTTRTFGLRLRQTGGHVEGLFVAGESAADVSGDVQKDGQLTLTGAAPAATVRDTSMTAELELRVTADGVIAGSLLHETTGPPDYAFVYGAVRIAGEVVSATRSDLPSFALVIDGTWSGRAAVRSCAPVSPDPYCYPFLDQEISSIQLTLQRTGASLTGTLVLGAARVPVSGSVSGTSFTLSGETIAPASGGNSLERVSGFTGSVDEFGRMSGTLLYETAFPVVTPRIGESAHLELRQVLKQQS
jgi:hypothetical protein